MMEFSKLIIFVPGCFGLTLIYLLCWWTSNEVFFRQFFRNDIKGFTYGSVNSRNLLELGFLSYNDVNGIGFIGKTSKIGYWCVVLIVLLWGLLGTGILLA